MPNAISTDNAEFPVQVLYTRDNEQYMYEVPYDICESIYKLAVKGVPYDNIGFFTDDGLHIDKVDNLQTVITALFN